MQLTDEQKIAALLALAKHNIPTDTQEVLVAGNPMSNIAPGALDAAMEAALTAQPAEAGVTVKELEWVERGGRYFASSMGVKYEIARFDVDGWSLNIDARPSWQAFGALDAAKAGAQADFDLRIRSVAHPTPAPQGMETAVAHIVTDPKGRQRVTLATKYDPMASAFWVGGEMAEGYSVTPLYATPQPSPSGVNAEMLAALKYARRFLRGIDHDVDYVDAAIAAAEAQLEQHGNKSGNVGKGLPNDPKNDPKNENISDGGKNV